MSDPKVKAGKEGGKVHSRQLLSGSRNTFKTGGGGNNPVADKKSTMHKRFVDVKKKI